MKSKTGGYLWFTCMISMLLFIPSESTADELIERARRQLVAIQEDDGAWPYEGVYRVQGEIPVGYRVGGTAIVCEALLYSSSSEDIEAREALHNGTKVILEDLDNPLMESSRNNTYDVRVWGHIYALDYFCRLTQAGETGEFQDEISQWIDKLTATLLEEELEEGGWNYASRRSHACFVTAPAVQALLWAKHCGAEVPDDVIRRSAEVLMQSRTDSGAFTYSGILRAEGEVPLPGSIARSAVCESTLWLLSEGSPDAALGAMDAFFEHWEELEARRQQTGTHRPPYGIAPYYFYYGHRYLAQAIATLPEDQQAEQRSRLRESLLLTKETEDTWNDRVFERSKSFGTAMAILALLGDQVPTPPPWTES